MEKMTAAIFGGPASEEEKVRSSLKDVFDEEIAMDM